MSADVHEQALQGPITSRLIIGARRQKRSVGDAEVEVLVEAGPIMGVEIVGVDGNVIRAYGKVV
jgi:hypothetical protein